MEDQNERSLENTMALSPTLRDLLAVVFRHRRLVTFSFLGLAIATIIAAVLRPPQYEAQMKILVKHERVDPVVTSEPNTVTQFNSQVVTEEDLNTEVELIKSRDLLTKVVKVCGLQSRPPSFGGFLHSNSAGKDNLRVAEAVRRLSHDLKVEPIKKSNMIGVSYRSPDPELSSRVLTTLANGYLVKHLEVRRFPGAFDFFQQQAKQYRNNLAADEKRLVDFSSDQGQGAVSPKLQRDLVVQRANGFEASLWESRTRIAETQERIRSLEAQLAATPPRLTTEDRRSDNPQLLAALKSSLATLELKRAELLDKYEPSYRLVQEVQTQIAQARSAIAAEQNAPVHAESTDQNPTYLWLDQELTKARANLRSYQAQASATQRTVGVYRDKAVSLERKEVAQKNLVRAAKVAEANYLLYLNKAEEAHISDALDNKRIANVSIAEAATVPPLPAQSPWLLLFLGILTAALVSVGSAFVADYFDSSFRTADELTAFLNTPVLAAFPKKAA